MSKKIKADCGCVVKLGQIVELCPGCVAGFQLIQLSKKVEGDGELWEDMIRKSLSGHADLVLNSTKKPKIITNESEVK